MLSAAVVIGALRVKSRPHSGWLLIWPNKQEDREFDSLYKNGHVPIYTLKYNVCLSTLTNATGIMGIKISLEYNAISK